MKFQNTAPCFRPKRIIQSETARGGAHDMKFPSRLHVLSIIIPLATIFHSRLDLWREKRPLRDKGLDQWLSETRGPHARTMRVENNLPLYLVYLHTESKQIRHKFLQVKRRRSVQFRKLCLSKKVPSFSVSHGLGSVIGLLGRQGPTAIRC